MTVETNDQPDAGGTASADSAFSGDAVHNVSLGGAFQEYLARVRGGDMGSLPAILGLVVLMIIFSLASDTFTTTLNLANLVTQAGADLRARPRPRTRPAARRDRPVRRRGRQHRRHGGRPAHGRPRPELVRRRRWPPWPSGRSSA